MTQVGEVLSKRGIMKTFIVIVVGILLLAYFGFDVRGEVEKLRVEHEAEINVITEFIFETVFPASEGIYATVQAIAEQKGVTLPNIPMGQVTSTTTLASTLETDVDPADQVVKAINGGNLDYGQIMNIIFKFFATPQNLKELSEGINMNQLQISTSTINE
jgi:hypothetical protein